MYKLATTVSVSDPGKQLALAGEIAPGAAPPAGFDTGTAFTLGVRGITYHDKDSKRTIVLMESKVPATRPVDALQEYRLKHDAKGQVVVEAQERVEMACQTDKLAVLRRQVKVATKGSRTDFLVMAQKPQRPDKVVVVLGDAPQGDDGQFMLDFLSRLQVKAWP